MLVPKPKKAFQSPGTQIFGLKSVLMMEGEFHGPLRVAIQEIAAMILGELVTQPKMPPWALIIFNPISWKMGK